jgi:tetratricopeptide (TPR) repeat protein
MGFNMKNILICCIVVSVFTIPPEAASNTNDDAKQAFVLGTKQFEQGKFAEAARSFQKAYDLRPAWKILLNIGECSAAAKEYGVALEAFESYLSQGGDEVPLDKRDNVVAEIRVLRELVGQLVAEAPDGSELIIDGIKRARFPLPGPVLVSAGVNHDVKILKDGYILIQKTMRINSGNSMELSALKPASEAVPETEPSTAEKPLSTDNKPQATAEEDTGSQRDKKKDRKKKEKSYSKPLRIAAWTTTAVGLGLLAGGVVTGVLAYTNNNDVNAGNCGSQGCDALEKKVKNLQITTNVLLGEGGGVTAVGAALLIVSYVQQKKRSKHAMLLPVIDSQNLGLTLTYQF